MLLKGTFKVSIETDQLKVVSSLKGEAWRLLAELEFLKSLWGLGTEEE
jgi:hypothetical protein